MDNIKIQDVRELCQRGAMRAYAKNGGIYLEDTTSKESVRLDNHPVAGHTGPGHTGKNGSRVERMFGKRESWPHNNVDEGQGPYKGFLMIECEECGEVKAFCAKRETYSFKCNCGHITPLENLRPLFMHCKCGEDFRYKTNITRPTISHTCIVCKAPVDMEINKKNTAYVTIR